MLELIISELPALAIVIIINILLGTYYNINLSECKFNIKIFLTGIIKACIIAISFIGIAYCFDTTDIGAIGVSPDLIINSAIVLYMGKSIQNLMKILGVENLIQK